MAQSHLQDAYENQTYYQEDYDFGVDGSEIDETDHYAPMPAGRYTLQAASVLLKDSKGGGGKMLAVEFQVTEGRHAGRKVFENYNLQHPNHQTVEIAQRQAKQWLIACGVDPNQRLTLALFRSLEGQKFTAQVGVETGREGYADRNRIKRYEVPGQAPHAPCNQSPQAPRNQMPQAPRGPAPQVARQPVPPQQAARPAAAGDKKPWER